MHNRVDCCCSDYENAVKFDARPLELFEGCARERERGEKEREIDRG